ncbi:hypothetical protein WDH52_22775 [Streptomyces sp. TRM70308]|uniref:hypothetical protein n=1 Tax=Streptomyces sp. TRM70308 TaxID=3131932 RepID=UPI003D01003C
MLGVLRNRPDMLDVAVPGHTGTEGAQTVRNMMSLLWKGQTSRHGSAQPTVPETVEAARMAVGLAVPLVEWFATGAVTRH